MPSEVVSKEMVPGYAIEKITVMDDYGRVTVLQISVSTAATAVPGTRERRIAEAIADHDARESAFENYAKTNGYESDLPALKAAGQLKKAKAKA